MMKNAFDPQEETERDWDIELRDDVKGEVESKYGKVADIYVVKESQVSTPLAPSSLRSQALTLWRAGRDLHPV